MLINWSECEDVTFTVRYMLVGCSGYADQLHETAGYPYWMLDFMGVRT